MRMPNFTREEVKEIIDLYNLSESDTICMTQLLVHILSAPFSSELICKLLKPITNLVELAVEGAREKKNA